MDADVGPPGVNRPAAETAPANYDRAALEHVLALRPWRDWDEMAAWLRRDGVNDPGLNPDELRGLRQDAERAG